MSFSWKEYYSNVDTKSHLICQILQDSTAKTFSCPSLLSFVNLQFHAKTKFGNSFIRTNDNFNSDLFDCYCYIGSNSTYFVQIKGSRTVRIVKVSLWYATLDFAFFILQQAILKRVWFYIQTKSFQMTQGGYQVIIILPIIGKMAAAKKQCFLRFLYWTEFSPTSFKVRGLQMIINFALV